jgi:hypothetical protein
VPVPDGTPYSTVFYAVAAAASGMGFALSMPLQP